MRLFLLVLSLIAGHVVPGQQPAQRKNTRIMLPAIAAIRPSELENDLEQLANDHFLGREAGTVNELSASAWLARKAQEAGLAPAGDNGTYFQFFTMIRHRIAPNSTISINGQSLPLWKEALVTQIAPGKVDAPVYFVGEKEPNEIDSLQLKGKAVVILASSKNIPLDISLHERRYPTFMMRKYGPMLINNGAASIVFIADALGEKSWEAVMPAVTRGLYDIEGGPNASVSSKPPVIWFHRSQLPALQQAGAKITAEIHLEKFEYPSVNVVGIIAGTDSLLKKECVLFSGHQDHDGIRTPYGNDSIYNGADDNGSMTVAMLAIARTFKAKPAKRSALFVWHGAEERGLLGSRWYASNPTVEKENIIAVLNGDMIGRNHPDSAALLGTTLPHRNSADLVKAAIDANQEGSKFIIDSSWDNPQHPEFWYFRSDHLPYARAGIPALFFTSLLHPDYHTPMDEIKSIDIKKLTRMTQWLYRTGWKVAESKNKPRLEPGFKLER